MEFYLVSWVNLSESVAGTEYEKAGAASCDMGHVSTGLSLHEA